LARTRTTKKLAQRIDLNYFKRPTPLKRAKLWLSLLLPLLALFWIAERSLSHDSGVYSAGRLSQAHAVLEKECAACHVQQAGVFSAKAADSACLACHDGPAHHPSQVPAPNCATCHTEHRLTVNLSAASDQGCAECHSDLHTDGRLVPVAARIRSIEDGHPEFAVIREDVRDPTTIKLNHAIHMKPIRQGPLGPNVQLECGDCHRALVDEFNSAWRFHTPMSRMSPYSSSILVPGSPVPDPLGWTRANDLPVLPYVRPPSYRALMALPPYLLACSGCHLLQFDKRFTEEVPHNQPSVIHAFVVAKFTEYIAAHPEELRESPDRAPNFMGQQIRRAARTLTPTEWIAKHTGEAEDLLWRKTCRQCHELLPGPQGDWPLIRKANPQFVGGVPNVAPPKFTTQWMPHARFDHDAHRGFTCESCHAKALTSTDSSDILLPGIATCKTCHAPSPGHADSRCSECHTYHDWSKRKEVAPKFTLPALRTGQ